MRIKTKLTISTSILFILIVALVILGAWLTNLVAKQAGEIKDSNYATVRFTREMQKSLIKMQSFVRMTVVDTLSRTKMRVDITEAEKQFEANLDYLKKNKTEDGDKEFVEELESAYREYKRLFYDQPTNLVNLEIKYLDVHSKISHILTTNLEEMNVKNNKTKLTADNGTTYTAILGTFAITLALVLCFNLPGLIANPFIEITQKIKQISNKHYDQKLYYQSNDELGELARAFNSMAEKLVEYENSSIDDLKTEKTRIESIVRNLNEGIILLDQDQNIKVINPIACSLLKINSKEVLEKYAPDIAVNNDLFRELLQDLNKNQTEAGSFKISKKGIENYYKKEVYKLYKDNQGESKEELAGYIISIRNITEFHLHDQAKTNFIAVVSHELKTPISSINLSLKLLQDHRIGELNNEQLKLVQSIKDESTRLLKITGELLDMSQVESGNINLQIQEVNALDIVSYSLEALKAPLVEKKVEIITSIPDNLPSVKADLEKSVWVLTNLLANAIRYTPAEGKIMVEMSESLNDLRVSVEDTGPGIGPEHKARIFQKFVQVQSGKQKEGVGLGLAICKEFIEKQGGKIWVESKAGVGSKFIFTLPLA